MTQAPQTDDAPPRGTLAQQGNHQLARAGDFGFESPGADRRDLVTEAGVTTAIARTEAEIKASLLLACKYPRDENAAYERLIRSCGRPILAEKAAYRFPRGGSEISGPSVYLAREMARVWGNMRYGVRIVSETEDMIHITGYAFDLEANNYVEMEAHFKNLIYRKKGGWQRPDERDKRELINRHGAVAVRNAILQLMPPDIIETALDESAKTMEKAAAGELKQDRDSAIRSIVVAFGRFGVTAAMLAEYLEHDLTTVSAKELAGLREVWTAIRDGQSQVGEYFQSTTPKAAAPADGDKSPFDGIDV